MNKINRFKCQCEHISHMPDHVGHYTKVNGVFEHKYEKEFNTMHLVEVQTEYGIFNICTHCAEGHMSKYARCRISVRGAEERKD